MFSMLLLRLRRYKNIHMNKKLIFVLNLFKKYKFHHQRESKSNCLKLHFNEKLTTLKNFIKLKY